jgi:adenosyl cobinamide kinase/adenosyl cobinamide phosphate guanylyltransferase
MSLTVLLGGARSGKSTLATSIATATESAVCYLATAEARDAEMAARIAKHRRERPASWTTIEEPMDLAAALDRIPSDTVTIIDCLTLWVSNLLEHDIGDDECLRMAAEAARVAAHRSGRTIAITNEVGSGIVPINTLARRYRDLLGMVNARWCARADDAFLVVAGRALVLSDPAGLGGVIR